MLKLNQIMMNLTKNILYIIAVSLCFYSCSTLKDASNAQGSGVKAIYNNTYSNIWNDLLSIINLEGLDLVSENIDEGKILAQRGLKAFSYGENVAIFVKSIDDNSTEVEIVSKKSLGTNITAKNWARVIHKELEQKSMLNGVKLTP